MPKRFTTVFVGSTYLDLVAHRSAVIDALLTRGLHPINMENFPADSRPPLSHCLSQLDQADLYIGIVGDRYGWTPPDESKSITRLEYEHAVRRRIEPLIFLATKGSDDLHESAATGKDAERLLEFKNLLRSRHSPREFTTPDDLVGRVLESIPVKYLMPLDETPSSKSHEDDLRDLTDRFRSASAILMRWPRTLPNNHSIERPELDLLESRISSETSVTLLLGPPGAGKSALLRHLCERALDRGIAVLGIKADFLPASVENARTLADELDLPDRVQRCLTVIAARQPVLLALDQLDALADLTDLKSGRLNALLQLIESVRFLPNVHVVASCREFEHRHDVRLRGIESDTLHLQLPSWEVVAQELVTAGITGAEKWSEKFRGLLRTPQHLNTFLEKVEETQSPKPFASYQQMLDDLWARKIHTPERQQLILALTRRLMRDEVMWVARAEFANAGPTVVELVADGILIQEQGRVGFRHQTLLEHARARAFLVGEDSLVEYVLERQDALFVRPTLWTTLTYLRVTSPELYRRELESLFESRLRLHVRYLLIDFLGQIDGPEAFEIALLAQRLSHHDERVRVAVAIRGHEGWFRALRSSHLPQMMQWPASLSWPMGAVLIPALKFARNDCLALIERYWLPTPEKDQLSAHVLRELPEWDERALQIAGRMARRSDRSDRWWLEDLVYVISESHPALAPRLVREILWGRLETEEPGGLSSRALFQRNEWYDLPAVTEAAPVEFLGEVWPWFLEVYRRLPTGSNSSVLNLYDGETLELDRDEGMGLPVEPLLSAIKLGIEGCAGTAPDRFLEITKSAWTFEAAAVQQLLSRGLAAGAAHFPKTALEYLVGDPRRLSLETSFRRYKFEAESLIDAVAPHLSPPELSQLINHICHWSKYRPGVETSTDQQRWNREARLRLLHAIPEECLDLQARAMIDEELRHCPGWRPQPRMRRGGRVTAVSPLDQSEIQAASDEELIDVLARCDDQQETIFERTEDGQLVRRGCPDALVNELAIYAKESPERACRLIPQLVTAGQQSAAERLVSTLAQAKVRDRFAFDLVRGIAQFPHVSESMKSSAAILLYNHAAVDSGLPDDLCGLLEEWMAGKWSPTTADDQSTRPEEPRSILWQMDSAVQSSSDAYWVFQALTHGLLMRRPPEVARWVGILRGMFRNFRFAAFWRSVAHELRWVTLQGDVPHEGPGFLVKLLHAFPNVRDSIEGVRLIAWTFRVLPNQFIQTTLQQLHSSSWELGAQAFGELLAVLALQEDADACVMDELNAAVTSALASDDQTSTDVLVGIAFAASHAWEDTHVRQRAGEILRLLITDGRPRVASALEGLFWSADDFPDDKCTSDLLEVIAAHPESITGRALSDLVEHLVTLAIHQREVVLAVCQSLLEFHSSDQRPVRTDWYAAGGSLVDIALTLQRFTETRASALDLFERLLSLGFGEAFASLDEIDLRPVASAQSAPRRARRRRRKVEEG